MNNSKIAIDNVSLEMDDQVDNKPMLRQRETELVGIIEALEHVSGSNYWKLLQDKVLNGVLESLQHRLRNEKNPTEIYRLQGQIVWAEKYTDLDKLAQVYRNDLQNIRKQLNANN
jgi:methionine salvage enolase-phosphatase E1